MCLAGSGRAAGAQRPPPEARAGEVARRPAGVPRLLGAFRVGDEEVADVRRVDPDHTGRERGGAPPCTSRPRRRVSERLASRRRALVVGQDRRRPRADDRPVARRRRAGSPPSSGPRRARPRRPPCGDAVERARSRAGECERALARSGRCDRARAQVAPPSVLGLDLLTGAVGRRGREHADRERVDRPRGTPPRAPGPRCRRRRCAGSARLLDGRSRRDARGDVRP